MTYNTAIVAVITNVHNPSAASLSSTFLDKEGCFRPGLLLVYDKMYWSTSTNLPQILGGIRRIPPDVPPGGFYASPAYRVLRSKARKRGRADRRTQRACALRSLEERENHLPAIQGGEPWEERARYSAVTNRDRPPFNLARRFQTSAPPSSTGCRVELERGDGK